jgi:methylenetetrahydrofolate dehydrogenase (NADP+)/methenyltetrahydrofolate cyclohydrolase
LLKKIKQLNEDNNIDGFIVQLPLPDQIDTQKVLMAIDPSKDVDGFHPENFGKMALDMTTFIPATPFGILELLERYNVETKGKHTVVIGRSHIVGRPMSILMGRKGFPGNSTVTLTHSYTKNIAQITTQADIIITARRTQLSQGRNGQGWRGHHRCGHHARRRQNRRKRLSYYR